MTEATQKKGLSKGCLIGLIVAGVLLVMVIIAAVVLWMNKEDVAKFGATTVIGVIHQQFVQAPPAGVDSAAFVAVSTAFTERFKADSVDAARLSALVNQIQTIPSDSKVDSVEAMMFIEAIFEYYPDLEELYPPPQMPDTMMIDSSDTDLE